MSRPKPQSHREELLTAFRIGPEDIEANRTGSLGPNQIRRLRRNLWINAAAGLTLAAPVIALALLSPHKTIWLYLICALLLALLVLMEASWARGIRRALKDGTVRCLTGPVTVQSQSRGGTWLQVENERVRLWTPYWHVGRNLNYRVYVAPPAKLVVAMEPNGWE